MYYMNYLNKAKYEFFYYLIFEFFFFKSHFNFENQRILKIFVNEFFGEELHNFVFKILSIF